MDESLVAGEERAGRERSGHKGKVSPQGPLFVSLFGRALMPFVEHFRKPGRPLLCQKPEAGRLGPELGVAAVGGQVFKPHVYCTLALVPACAFQVFHCDSGPSSPSFGQRSGEADPGTRVPASLYLGLIPGSIRWVKKSNREGTVTTGHVVSPSITVSSCTSILRAQMPLWTVLPSPGECGILSPALPDSGALTVQAQRLLWGGLVGVGGQDGEKRLGV